MLRRFFPKEERFFDLFTQVADNLIQAARVLCDLTDDYRDVETREKALAAAEERGDELTHLIINRVNRTFITPFDREDIHDLAKALDDVLNSVHLVAARMLTYRIVRPTAAARELSHIIVHACEAIAEAIGNLQKLEQIEGPIREIARLEDLTDHVHLDAEAALFADGGNAFNAMMWMKIYETMEEATNRAEDVGNILQDIRAKQA